MGGTPPAIIDNVELMSLFVPLLRADLAVADSFLYRAAPPLPCPITAFGGEDDSRACPEELWGWAEQTACDFSLEVLPGNHFFLHSASAALLDSIGRILRADNGSSRD
jgi:medium-chain acyl-[acyl-carrier-protein] hydrolase